MGQLEDEAVDIVVDVIGEAQVWRALIRFRVGGETPASPWSST